MSLLMRPAARAAATSEQKLTVDCATEAGALPHFWSATGFARPITDPPVRQMMQYLGSVPHQGCLYVRPHDLLWSVEAFQLLSDKPTYDWSELDQFLDLTVQSGNKLIFELMGVPSSRIRDFRDEKAVHAWKRFIRDLALHLQARYGQEEVRSWLFECWNEPNGDYGWKWDDDQEFFNYYDACAEGLREADPQLKFGGPGVTLFFGKGGQELMENLIDHCLNGKNYFTGGPTRLDFISFHIKEKAQKQVTQTEQTINKLLARFGDAIKDKPFINDECDMKWGWASHTAERQDSWYASYIARQVTEHWLRLGRGKGWNILISNDNAFLGDWDQRTQLALFGQVEQFALIKKPQHNIFTALALLGDRECPVSGFEIKDQGLSVLASRRGQEQVAILISNYEDAYDSGTARTALLEINNIPFNKGRIVHYRFDNELSNAYPKWLALGSPKEAAVAALRERMELERLGGIAELTKKQLTMTIPFPHKSVSLILITKDPGQAPAAVEGLRATRYAGMTAGQQEILLEWQEVSRNIKTYEVLYAATAAGPFERVNKPELIATAFVHACPAGQKGYYKLRAIDYWDRVGNESPILTVEE